ncbi:hypothetical protein [uncultured phage MedDCM-OCT-S08-C1731]|nr:hypothetical protein [uncultured phage MedDCM-OCT-S08-C1731]
MVSFVAICIAETTAVKPTAKAVTGFANIAILKPLSIEINLGIAVNAKTVTMPPRTSKLLAKIPTAFALLPKTPVAFQTLQ